MIRTTPRTIALAGLATALLVSLGCSARTNRSNIIAMTNTSIGVSGGLSPASQIPQIDVGYKRQEFAKVPTNRCDAVCPSGPVDLSEKTCDGKGACNTTTVAKTCGCGQEGGAKGTGNVLMEIQGQAGLGAAFSGEIYQRLAVGDIAVRQPGAWFLMMKGMSREAQTTAAATIDKYLELEKARLEKGTDMSKVPWDVLDEVSTCLGTNMPKATEAWNTLKTAYSADTDAAIDRLGTLGENWADKDPKNMIRDVLKRQSEERAKTMQSAIDC